MAALTAEKAAVKPKPLSKMIRLISNGNVFYWSLLGWSDYYALGLTEEDAASKKVELAAKGYDAEVIPFARISVQPKPRTQPYHR